MIKKILIKNKYIYTNFILNEYSNKLVIIASGLSGSMNSSLVKESVNFFAKNYNVLTFNLSKDSKFSPRDIFNIRDLDYELYLTVLSNLFESYGLKYKEIIIVGHSFSAPIILIFAKVLKDADVKIIMWDPSIISELFTAIRSYLKYDSVKEEYFYQSDKERLFVFSKKLLDSFKPQLDPLDFIDQLSNKILIVGAEQGAGKNATTYFAKLIDRKDCSFGMISKTGHLFGNYRARKQLLLLTKDFIDRT